MNNRAPTTGGQYHWVSEFSPKSCQKFLSYVTGWLLVLGWQAGAAINAYLAGAEIQGLIILNNPGYAPKNWHGTLLLIAVALVAVIFNTVLAKQLPLIENVILVLHIAGFFAILIPLWVTSEHKPASEVFLNFQDNGHWGSVTGACFLGLLSPVYSFIGTAILLVILANNLLIDSLGPDSAAHMGESIISINGAGFTFRY